MSTKKAIFATKIMYKTIQNKPIINNLWIIPFRSLCLNQESKTKCEECFPCELDENSMIIYNTSDDGFVVLGYYKLDSQNITESLMFNKLRNITYTICQIDDTEVIKQIKCSHICSWVFDISLRNKECLTQICSHMLSMSSPSYLLWYDGKEELVFYPRNRKYSAIEHFVNAFLKE